MFADDKSIEYMQQLFIEFKKYLELQKEYTKLEVTENCPNCFLRFYWCYWSSYSA